MRLIPILIAAVVLASIGLAPTPAPAQNLRADSGAAKQPERSVTVNAVLILASNEKGQTDPRLAEYERNLRNVFRFEQFTSLGQGSTRMSLPGDAEIRLPANQTLDLEAAYYGEGMVWLRVVWKDGGRVFMNNVYTKWARGTPIVVGGAAKDGGRLILIVTPR